MRCFLLVLFAAAAAYAEDTPVDVAPVDESPAANMTPVATPDDESPAANMTPVATPNDESPVANMTPVATPVDENTPFDDQPIDAPEDAGSSSDDKSIVVPVVVGVLVGLAALGGLFYCLRKRSSGAEARPLLDDEATQANNKHINELRRSTYDANTGKNRTVDVEGQDEGRDEVAE